jgi:hypothetical protein
MRGSLHCAVHDETVNNFGRDDALLGWVWNEKPATAKAKCEGLFTTLFTMRLCTALVEMTTLLQEQFSLGVETANANSLRE